MNAIIALSDATGLSNAPFGSRSTCKPIRLRRPLTRVLKITLPKVEEAKKKEIATKINK